MLNTYKKIFQNYHDAHSFHHLLYLQSIFLLISAGYINSFLAWKAWIPLAKLNFGAYLVHLIVMNVVLLNMKTTMTWSWVSMVSV